MDRYAEIMNLMHAIVERKQDTIGERTRMISELNDPRLEAITGSLSILGLHILSALREEALTGTALATSLHATRGGITRAAKTLLDNGLITATQAPMDKKKIFYALTTDGSTIAKVHDEMHQNLEGFFRQQVLQRFTDADQETIIAFLQACTEYAAESENN